MPLPMSAAVAARPLSPPSIPPLGKKQYIDI